MNKSAPRRGRPPGANPQDSSSASTADDKAAKKKAATDKLAKTATKVKKRVAAKAIKKSELYSKLWKSCDELRGGMDASQYKDYILVLLFMKYVSDKTDTLLDIPVGGSFADMVKLKGKPDIGEKMDKIIAKLAETNGLTGVIDVASFNDPEKLGNAKDMVDRLSKLVGIFEGLDFSANRADGDDLLGDAYEYLMRNFATESGKSKGQFYTPAEVSRIKAKVIGLGSVTNAKQTIHDPTCGSGSLLLKAHNEAKERTGFDLALYGQEMDNATRALAKMNMILHGCETADIWKDNTLSSPHFVDEKSSGKLKTFDFVVANPPFSSKAWTSGFNPAEDLYHRFEYGIPPPKNGDYAFLLHILTCLKSTGRGAVILPHGVLFRGNAESDIRREIVSRGFIQTIIGLPANLFYGTGIPACIIVLDKAGAAERVRTGHGIFMVDASKGFRKDGNKNRLRDQDIHRIVDTVTKHSEVPGYAAQISLDKIKANDYNLNLPRYIDSSDAEDIQDIDGHLRGGIPDRDLALLDSYWQVLPSVRATLFSSAGRKGYSKLNQPVSAIKDAIFGHAEFTTFNQSVTALFTKWRKRHQPLLKALAKQCQAKTVIHDLSEDLLTSFAKAQLVDPYDIYQHMMDYWAATMQDDVVQISQYGWSATIDTLPNEDLIPPALIVGRYFAKEQAAITALEADRDAKTAVVEELAEEHGGEDGLLADALTDKGKLTAASVKKRLAEIRGVKSSDDEQEKLTEALACLDAESEAKRAVNAAQDELDGAVDHHYDELTEDEVKTLVVDDKWLSTIAAAVQGELDRVSQTLTGRIRQLAERYAMPLPELSDEVEMLAKKVDGHLANMGFKP